MSYFTYYEFSVANIVSHCVHFNFLNGVKKVKSEKGNAQ